MHQPKESLKIDKNLLQNVANPKERKGKYRKPKKRRLYKMENGKEVNEK